MAIPWTDRLDSACSGHDSLLFPAVSGYIVFYLRVAPIRLLRVAGQMIHEEGEDEDRCVLHIWTF